MQVISRYVWGMCGVTVRSLAGKYGETGYLVRLNRVNRMGC